MSDILKYLILLLFIISSKSEIEYGPCIDNKRKVILENGTVLSLECKKCEKDFYTEYKDGELICQKCPNDSYNYGNDTLIDYFSEKILSRHSLSFNTDCDKEDKSLCPKWMVNILSIKLENIKDNIDSKSILKWYQYYMEDGKLRIKYINYNGDLNKYLNIYINNKLVYKDDTRHSKVKTKEFTIKKGNNEIEIQYIVDKNIPQNNKDIESFFEIYEIEMIKAETSSLECQKYAEIDILQNSLMNNCSYYVKKCSENDFCTFRFYVEESGGNNYKDGTQTISYNKINESVCNESFSPIPFDIDVEQCSYGQYRNIIESNNTYTCGQCNGNNYNDKIINYETSCPEQCDTNEKDLKKILYINNFKDQSEHEMNINIIDIIGHIEIDYKKYNLREDTIIFFEIEEKEKNTKKTIQLINPNIKKGINDGNFLFKIPLKKGEYFFKIKGKNLKMKYIKVINGKEGGNYLCTNKLNPEDEVLCNEDEYYSRNHKNCSACPAGTFISENSKCVFTEEIISNKFILENTMLFETGLLDSKFNVLKNDSITQYHLYLSPTFPLIYSTIPGGNSEIIGSEFNNIKLVRGKKDRGIILSYIHKNNDLNYTTYLYIKCNKTYIDENIRFIYEGINGTDKYIYFFIQSNISCPYCLESEITEVSVEGKCKDNKKETFNIKIKNESECVIKPYNDNSSSSKTIIDKNSEVLFFNDSLDEDKDLKKYFNITEKIPIFYELESDKIVTETQREKDCGGFKPLYIVLIVLGGCILIIIIVIIIIKVLKSKRAKIEDNEISNDDNKEMKLKASAFDE